jgi:hypothetical protein
MGAVRVPASANEALGMLESAVGFLVGADPAQLPDEELALCLRVLERADAVETAARGRFLQAFDARDAHLADGQRTSRTWMVHSLRVTRGQAAEQDCVGGQEITEGQDCAAKGAAGTGATAEVLAMLEHQILAKVLQVVSGPGGAASFLRRNLLGKGLNGPSLPLDVGQTDDIPVHLRRLVALRDQTCQFPGGCDQPASCCEPHHVVHRRDGGRTSLTGLKDWCWWHHHVVLHQMGWALTVHPDGTSQVRNRAGKIIRSHSPPPRPG